VWTAWRSLKSSSCWLVLVIMACFFSLGGNSEILARHPWIEMGPVVLAAVRRTAQASSQKQQMKKVFAFLELC
jgi:hypothetical protein